MKKRSNVFRGLAAIFLALLVLLQVVAGVANSWANKVNELLGITDTSIERSEDPADYRFTADFESGSALIDAEIAINTRLAAEGTVALKGTPAISGKKVTLFGMRSGEKMQFGGSMGELIDAANVVPLADAMTANGFEVNPTMVQFYKDMEANYSPEKTPGGNVVSSYEGQGTTVNEVPVSEYNAADIGDYKDAAIIVFGRDAGESCCFYPGLNGLSNPSEFSNSPTGNILSLSNEERDLLNWVKGQGFSKIVVLLNSGTSMEIDELKKDDAVSSILWIGNPGAYGTYGIAKLLSGEVLPSGHLPDTFAVNSAKSPAAQNLGIYNFANAADIETTNNNALRSSWYLVESEGIYTGYKYYETRYFDSVLNQGNATNAAHGETANGSGTWSYDNEVSYTFGYGLEGSTFSEEITNINVDWTGETDSTVTVKVTNTGSVAAKHAVQLYVSVPYTDSDKQNKVEKSAIQLVGYAKTGEASENSYADVVLLDPGASEEVTIPFNAQDISSYDMSYEHDGVSGAYLLSAGDYWFATGNGAHDAVQAVLKAAYPDVAGTLQPTGAVKSEHLDKEIYRTESNGVTIQNQLTGSDLNSWNTDATVTYLSRTDWAGTFPTSVDTLTATQDMITYLRNATYDAAAALANYDGPTEFTYGADNGVKAVDLVGLDYDDPKYDELLDEMTLEDLCNQYIAFLEEIDYIALPKEMPADSPLGIIGMIGQRTKGSIYEMTEEDPSYGHHTNVYVSAPVVAATFAPKLQQEEGRLVANDALMAGYSIWYGPGMNLHRTPYNGRNVGYYSEDAVLCGNTSLNVHKGLNGKGLVTNTKHFAFNDQETNRDGIAVFLSEQAARENELRGFQIPIRAGELKGLMTAFNRIGVTHVGAHTGLMMGILRGEWAFNGYVITDSVKSAQYFLPRECLLAGNNQMLGGSNNGTIWKFTADDVKDDPVIQNALRESFHTKLYYLVNSVLLNGMTPDTEAGGGEVWWVVMFRIGGGLCLVAFVVFFVLFILRARKENKANWNGFEITADIVALILTIVGTVLFAMSYTTGYYTFGQMQSGVIASLLGGAIVCEVLAIAFIAKMPKQFWTKFLVFVIVGCLAGAVGLILGDRVEGIGNCIVTDYDSGHGGEEAIYMSLAGAILMLISIVYCAIGSFSKGKDAAPAKDKEKKSSKGLVRNVAFGVTAAAVLLAVLIPTYNLTKKNPAGTPGGPGGEGGTPAAGGTYTISFNQNNGNLEGAPKYQFLGADNLGIASVDARLYVDVSLTLDGNGGYKLYSESYCVEAGKRAEVGDDTGLGSNYNMTAEGSYVTNEDGTVTTSVPTHAVLVLEFDTYSQQMKGALGLDINGTSEDGTYDSDSEPAVLDFVPETVWTLSGSSIVSYRDANVGGTYSVSFNQNNGNLDAMGADQFLGGAIGGICQADSRLFIDMTLTLDGANYDLFVESYCIEAGKRAEIGDDTGLGMVLTMHASGPYTDNGDGTYTTAKPTHAAFEMRFDTYSQQMKDATGVNVGGKTDDGLYDSDSEPAVLDMVPETIWTLADGAIVSYQQPDSSEQEGPEGGETTPAAGVTFTSDDGGTTLTFSADGTYTFAMPSMEGVQESGTYTYESGVLTVTNGNDVSVTAEGDPLVFHYVSAMSDQLVGDFTIPAADLEAGLAGGGEATASTTITSDDGATSMTFNSDGTYVFAFPDYNIEDPGTWTYEGGVLTVINSTGTEQVADGDPMKLHYVSGVSDQLTGDFTIAASDLSFESAAGGSTTITSDDGATNITFNADGTYVFAFPDYGVEDAGTWTYEGGVLTVINSTGAEQVADGDPMKLHYVSGVSEQLTGDFTIAASDLSFESAAGGSATIASDDGATSMTFNADGTYVFAFPDYNIEDPGTWTYEGGVLTVINSTGTEQVADGDPMKLHYVSGVSDQLTGDFTIAAADLSFESGSGSGAADVEVASDDGATKLTLKGDGTYVFAFPDYGVEDAGTWTYEDGVLTVTNANGTAMTAEGDPLKLHYVSSMSDALTGDFTIEASALAGDTAAGAPVAADVEVASDDGATKLTLKGDGTYVFAFPDYGVEDAGTWTYEGGVLTVTNANGLACTADGDPLKLHYVSSMSDALTGDFTIEASALAGDTAAGAPVAADVEVASDDGATKLTLKGDGTYVFAFPDYGVEDPGTWTYENGVLTVTNANGVAATAEGDPLKLHYVSSMSDALTGDFTIPAADLA